MDSAELVVWVGVVGVPMSVAINVLVLFSVEVLLEYADARVGLEWVAVVMKSHMV